MQTMTPEALIYPLNQPVSVSFACPLADGDYALRILPVSYPDYPGIHDVRVAGGRLTVEMGFRHEQEVRFVLYQGDEEVALGAVYALAPDLLALTPVRGDFHMHSCRSDGVEIPAEVAAHCRRKGLDIAAITDHGQYAPSIEAIDAYQGVDLDLVLCTGEEVHPPETALHIVHFGGSSSINALFDTPEYRVQVQAIAESLPPLADGCDPLEYAASLWVYRRAQETGGFTIFCHPYWEYPFREAHQVFHVSEGLTTQTFMDRPFDAYELLGGYALYQQQSNVLQISRYLQENARGPLPVVGVSDAHGCLNDELFGWYSTLIFARNNTYEAVAEAIKGCHGVAVEAIPGRETRAYGPHRLVAYGLFLLEHYYPLHDALCQTEGELMLRHVGGDTTAAAALKHCKGQVATLNQRLFVRV